MVESKKTDHFVFPRWANYLLPLIIIGGLGGATYMPILAVGALSPTTLAVGYRPKQPVPYSHQLHVAELGMDCLYCHNTADKTSFAAIPATETCMNCHHPDHGVRVSSDQLAPVYDSYASGKPVPWVKVHDLADYAYFNHGVHVSKGIGCISCHGRVDKMDEDGVWQVETLSMGWCLDCHRAPENHLRPVEEVTNMSWDPVAATGKTQQELGLELKRKYNIHDAAYMTNCSLCHR